MRTAPIDVGKAEIQITQRTAHGNVSQAHVVAGAKRFFFQAFAHGHQAVVHLAQLAINPNLAAFAFRATHPMRLQASCDGGVQQAIGQSFPGFHLGAFPATLGTQFAHR